MTKFAKYYQDMWDHHKEPLTRFQEAHDAYQQNRRDSNSKQVFDAVGKEALDIIREWDQKLCTQMEKGTNSVFSSKVSEKFWNEVKKDFPLVDLVGVTVTYS